MVPVFAAIFWPAADGEVDNWLLTTGTKTVSPGIGAVDEQNVVRFYFDIHSEIFEDR